MHHVCASRLHFWSAGEVWGVYRNLTAIALCNRAANPRKTLGLRPLVGESVNSARGTAGSTPIALWLQFSCTQIALFRELLGPLRALDRVVNGRRRQRRRTEAWNPSTGRESALPPGLLLVWPPHWSLSSFLRTHRLPVSLTAQTHGKSDA